MHEHRVHLLDIEGTTSSIAFVYDTLFPYVRAAMPNFLATHWSDSETQSACALIAREGGLPVPLSPENILAEVFRLMDADVKSTGLKELQGLVSKEGYASGKLRSHFYADVPVALKRWTDAGISCCVYSSGSIGAQKSFYRYAAVGDLTPFISANFDTTTGPKRDAASYAKIAEALDTAPRAILFFSDVSEELDAARLAGLDTILVVRPGNKPVAESMHRRIENFDEVV